jgi:hypothetical protein
MGNGQWMKSPGKTGTAGFETVTRRTPGKPRELSVDPLIKGLSENIWRPAKFVPDPRHRAPLIEDKGIAGDTNPPIVPETDVEDKVMLFHQVHHNVRLRAPEQGPAEELDWCGEIIDFDLTPFLEDRGLCEAMEKVLGNGEKGGMER